MQINISNYIEKITNLIPELVKAPGFEVTDESYVGLASILPYIKKNIELYSFFILVNVAFFNYSKDEVLKNMIAMEIIDPLFHENQDLAKEILVGEAKNEYLRYIEIWQKEKN